MTSRPAPPEMTLDAAVALMEQGRLDAVLDAVREHVVRLGDGQVGALASAALPRDRWVTPAT